MKHNIIKIFTIVIFIVAIVGGIFLIKCHKLEKAKAQKTNINTQKQNSYFSPYLSIRTDNSKKSTSIRSITKKEIISDFVYPVKKQQESVTKEYYKIYKNYNRNGEDSVRNILYYYGSLNSKRQ